MHLDSHNPLYSDMHPDKHPVYSDTHPAYKESPALHPESPTSTVYTTQYPEWTDPEWTETPATGRLEAILEGQMGGEEGEGGMEEKAQVQAGVGVGGGVDAGVGASVKDFGVEGAGRSEGAEKGEWGGQEYDVEKGSTVSTIDTDTETHTGTDTHAGDGDRDTDTPSYTYADADTDTGIEAQTQADADADAEAEAQSPPDEPLTSAAVLRQRVVLMVTIKFGILAGATIMLDETTPLFLKLAIPHGGFSFTSSEIGTLISISSLLVLLLMVLIMPYVSSMSLSAMHDSATWTAIPLCLAWPVIALLNR
ncbi:hypothetical protein B484DRAFT_286061 [Ochromonadaceae sp. CCMP2298]|nr:hypothetical protein B484DRAFT_286061 [Ochromonadaceae sp. CCMP2298]